jgi:glycosyltransferase involved in cell wall biosynthesis
MVKIVSYTIVNNEISYIKDIIDYHISWLDGMYVLDTGSTDGTLEYLKDKAKENPKLIVEEYHQKFTPQYEVEWNVMKDPFPEVQVRNFALKRAEELLNPNWIIQLDGDEIFLEKTKDIINKNKNALCIGCSTICPTGDISTFPAEFRGGHKLYDPHVRIWRAKSKILHMRNPAFRGKEIHCIPVVDGLNFHLFHHPQIKFINDPIHIHLHWVYGKKIDMFYKQLGFTSKADILRERPVNQFIDLLPPIFLTRRKEWEEIKDI